MPAIAFLTSVPESITLGQGLHRSRIQLAKIGKFKDPRYGNFSITHKDFDTWEANFAALSSPSAERRGAPLDFDHNPEKRGDTEAAGWIISMDRMGKDGNVATPNELWGVVEWTDVGLEAVKNGRYAYISPSYAGDYKDETGKSWGTHLVGAALTNRPFLRMATITLDAMHFAEELPEPEAEDSPRHMPELTKQLLTSLGLADEKADTVLAADDPGAALKVALAEVAKPEADPEPDKAPTYGGKTLAELATEQGMVIMSGADVAKLAADASAGAAAAKTLHEDRFAIAWEKAVDKGKVLPSTKDAFTLAYGADPEATLKQLGELPEDTIPMRLRGSNVTPDEDGAPTTLSTDTALAQKEIKEGGVRVEVDPDREKMAQRMTVLYAEGKSDDEVVTILSTEFPEAVAS